jgi:hypothetical protein
LQKLLLHICITAILIHWLLATARETPRMAFAPNFDLFGCLNQSSGQSRFVQKLMFLLSNNGINIFHFKTPFPK